jgi:hypothetical protein
MTLRQRLLLPIGATTLAARCASGRPGDAASSPACARFLAASETARLPWALEREFSAFETRVTQGADLHPR